MRPLFNLITCMTLQYEAAPVSCCIEIDLSIIGLTPQGMTDSADGNQTEIWTVLCTSPNYVPFTDPTLVFSHGLKIEDLKIYHDVDA